MSKLKVLYIGSLNTDILALGLDKFPKAGEHVYGDTFKLAPGGKSRNAAHMTANLMHKDQVAMAAVTVKDSHDFYKIPLDALKEAGVNTQHVVINKPTKLHALPGIAIVMVDQIGQNRILVFPGVSHLLNRKHVNNLEPTFAELAKNEGYVCLGLEAPLETIVYAKNKASEIGIKVILDPGGVKNNIDYSSLIDENIFLIKPNEHEATILTREKVFDKTSAKKAAQVLKKKGIKNILITLGEKGAYLTTENKEYLFNIPKIKSKDKDSTGCGDQALATLVSQLAKGKTIEEASHTAVIAGTLQFTKPGVNPISYKELKTYL